MKKFLKSNSLIWIYFGLALLIELTAVFVTSDKFYIRSPLMFLLIQLFIMLILLCIPSNKTRHRTASILLIFFMIVDLVFIVIFEKKLRRFKVVQAVFVVDTDNATSAEDHKQN